MRIAHELLGSVRDPAARKVPVPPKALNVPRRGYRGLHHAEIRRREILRAILPTTATRQNFALLHSYRETRRLGLGTTSAANFQSHGALPRRYADHQCAKRRLRNRRKTKEPRQICSGEVWKRRRSARRGTGKDPDIPLQNNTPSD